MIPPLIILTFRLLQILRRINAPLAAFILLTFYSIRKAVERTSSIILYYFHDVRSCFKSYLNAFLIIFVAALFIGVSIKSYFLLWTQYPFLYAIFPLVTSVNADETSDFGGDGKRVAAYRRVSSTKQVNQGFSLEVQKETLEKMVRLNKPSMVYWFSDAGKTGTTLTNRKISDITQLAKGSKIDELWVCYIDRLGRNTHDLLDLYNRLTELGVSIRTPDHFYSPNDLASLLLVMVQFYGAEDDNKKRRDRALDSKRRRFREKKWNKGYTPLGYVIDGDWLKKIPAWVVIINEAFISFNYGHNLSETVHILNASHSNTLLTLLTTSQLKSILTDPLYAGKPEYLGEVVDDPLLAFIKPEIFEETSRNLQGIKEQYERVELGPFERVLLEDGCDDIALEEIDFMHKHCGGKLRKNGTDNTHGPRQQIFQCSNCGKQLKLPRISKNNKDQLNPFSMNYGGEIKTKKKPRKNKSKSKINVNNGNLMNYFKAS